MRVCDREKREEKNIDLDGERRRFRERLTTEKRSEAFVSTRNLLLLFFYSPLLLFFSSSLTLFLSSFLLLLTCRLMVLLGDPLARFWVDSFSFTAFQCLFPALLFIARALHPLSSLTGTGGQGSSTGTRRTCYSPGRLSSSRLSYPQPWRGTLALCLSLLGRAKQHLPTLSACVWFWLLSIHSLCLIQRFQSHLVSYITLIFILHPRFASCFSKHALAPSHTSL